MAILRLKNINIELDQETVRGILDGEKKTITLHNRHFLNAEVSNKLHVKKVDGNRVDFSWGGSDYSVILYGIDLDDLEEKTKKLLSLIGEKEFESLRWDAELKQSAKELQSMLSEIV